ncbi:MAG TPA: hypothetical protein VFQ53_19000 [Kofleriaceae bacterium]|nr:hypothetical protein [Kofleriaceae bacterium]
MTTTTKQKSEDCCSAPTCGCADGKQCTCGPKPEDCACQEGCGCQRSCKRGR